MRIKSILSAGSRNIAGATCEAAPGADWPARNAGRFIGCVLRRRSMRLRRVAALALAGVYLFSGIAGAQGITNGGLSGTLVSASVQAPFSPTGGITTTIFTTPKKGHFVLTQVGSVRGSVDLFSVTDFGPIAPGTFTPGLAVPPGASVQCTTLVNPGSSSGQTDCWITGVLEK